MTLQRLFRENQILSLEEAHWQLSAVPARCAGFRDRGTLVEGAPADIGIYDFEKLRVLPEEGAHDLPGNEWRHVQRAEGYRYLPVNGEVTVENDQQAHAHPGQMLRHGRSAM